MKKNKFKRSFLFLLIVSYLSISSCRSEEATVSCFPQSVVNVVLNLNLPAYQNLQNVGGWIYVNEQGSGTRGLIVVRTTTGFLVFDRNAPHICPDNNTTLNVVDNLKIVCPKDNAEWILYSGEPISVAKIPPKRYFYQVQGSVLSIYN